MNSAAWSYTSASHRTARIRKTRRTSSRRSSPSPSRCSVARAPRFPSLPEVLAEKIHWRASALAYLRRLERLGTLTEWRYRSLVIEASQAGYRRSEGDIERETSQLIPKVLDVLRSEGVGISQVASDLDVTASEVRGLMFAQLRSLNGGASQVRGERPHLSVVN